LSVLLMEVTEIEGRCPIYRTGDKIVIDGRRIDLQRTGNLCIHALSSLLHYAVALREGIALRRPGLPTDGRVAYIHCPDPGKPYIEDGKVIFKCYCE